MQVDSENSGEKPPVSFPKLKLKQYAKIQSRETSEAKYWKSFNATSEDKLQGTPTWIDFHPVNSCSYIVTGSIKVTLYDSATDKAQRAYSRFQDDAFSGKFRADGKLILAGDKTGAIKVFDVPSKSVLRQILHHSSAVRSLDWASDAVHFYSGSDDKSCARWDLSTEQLLWRTEIDQHTDYVRSIAASPVSPQVFCSGSYDHSVKLWDCRINPLSSSAAVMSAKLPHPVETTLFTASGTMFVAASGSEVRIFDVLAGGKLLHTFNNHQKNVTALAMDGTGTRLLSAGLDGHVKVASMQTMQVVHGMKFNSPIMSMAISKNNQKLVVGLINGSVVARNRRTDAPAAKQSDAAERQQQIQMFVNAVQAATQVGAVPDASAFSNTSTSIINPTTAGNLNLLENSAAENALLLQQHRHYKGAGMVHVHSNQNADSSTFMGGISVTIPVERSARLQPFEKHLKKFNYQAALDAVLRTRNPVTIVTVLEELCRRDGLGIALSGRDESTLEPLVSFSARYVSHPKYSRLIIEVVHKVLDLYAGVLGQSDAIDELFAKLHKQVQNEVGFQRKILRVMGSLDGIISAATMPKK